MNRESAEIQATAKDYYRDLSLASDDKWRLFDAVGTEMTHRSNRVETSPVEHFQLTYHL